MTRALIGYSGFVGSNLAVQQNFTHFYNSKNFTELAGQSFDEVVCAGVQAVKWRANQNPEADWAGITPLLDVLDKIEAGRFTLISTVDVYKTPVGVTETTPIITEGLHAYGLHRWRVEEHIRRRFTDHRILRLPGLYGVGLKKNLIHDVLTGSNIDGFDARSAFQFYNLERIGADVATAGQAAPGTYNLAVAPVTVAEVVQSLTGAPYTHQTEAEPFFYDMRSQALAPWGISGPYLEDAAASLAGIGAYGASPP